ncbi:MAG: T9SS type A sorting domain-containing protein [Bacteroidia bacterium]
MRVFTLLVFLIVSHLLLLGQETYSILGRKHSVRINANGSIGIDPSDNSPSSFYNNDSNLPLLRQAGLWIVAEDTDGNFHTATHYVNAKDSFDFWAGPVDTLTGQTGDEPKWNRTWKITVEDIESHKKDFNEPGYKVPQNIDSWPGNGEQGYSRYLAPFNDYNQNGIYDPENGDFPIVKGTNNVYCIFNDLKEEHNASFGQEIGIEVFMNSYDFEKSQEIAETFIEYIIVNRRPTDYKSVKVGFFISGACGKVDDNYAGTLNHLLPTIFLYNGDDIDEGHFQDSTPYISATFLNENLESSIAFNDTKSKNGTPVLNQHFVNYSSSIWKDGSPLTIGEDGTTGSTNTSYIFAQSSDGSDDWSEQKELNAKGGRTIVGFMNSEEMNQNDYIKMNVVLNAGRTGNRSNISKLIAQESVASFRKYRELSNAKSGLKNLEIKTFPNPSNGKFTIHLNRQILGIQISDIQGNTVLSKEINKKYKITCNTNLPLGVYILQLRTKEGTVTSKLCIRP